MAETSTPTGTRPSVSADTGGGRSRGPAAGPPFRKPRWPRAYAFALVTGALFRLVVQRNEASQHGQAFAWSEFLQLIWQAAGLALFYYWGSSQPRESDDRIEAKLDALLRERNLDPENP
ncbi:hypothetical protein GA0070558_114114 [Micromonospora haikouensis]|uniref:Uncharacterized protein n=1 Tax=Micromonospora haikouensis TaxID=686309 RepID=A0A1C4WBJ7_9ACTN|nr:hypothetical protein [Micromonospora haikouensis]SCE93572.1 hypothetical protein GA0070558_114114 [Micromonospora haikouensis]